MLEYLDLHAALGVEVGSYAGESALIMADSGKFGRLICVDAWVPTHAEGEAVFDAATAGHPVIRKLKATSLSAAQAFKERGQQFDFVYIDADHRYSSVVLDLHAWQPLVRPGGYLTGHDYSKRNRMVIKAIHDTLGDPDMVFMDGSWVFRQ